MKPSPLRLDMLAAPFRASAHNQIYLSVWSELVIQLAPPQFGINDRELPLAVLLEICCIVAGWMMVLNQ